VWNCAFPQYDLGGRKPAVVQQYKTRAEREKAQKRQEKKETEEALQRCHEYSIESCKMPNKELRHIQGMMSEKWTMSGMSHRSGGGDDDGIQPTAVIDTTVDTTAQNDALRATPARDRARQEGVPRYQYT